MKNIKVLLSDYGIVFILFALVVLFSLLTIEEQTTTGTEAGLVLASEVKQVPSDGLIILVTTPGPEDQALASAFLSQFDNPGEITHLQEGPPAVRQFLESKAAGDPMIIAVSTRASRWLLFRDFIKNFPVMTETVVLAPKPRWSSNFLKRENLLNVTDQIAVIAIIAIGMTMVIITGGIDLSVGSLVALSAVLVTKLIQSYLGAQEASVSLMILAGVAAIITCGLIGLLSGVLTTYFKIPSFIVTLSMMLIASGLAYTVSEGQSIYEVPDNFIWLGRARVLGVPVSVWIMLALYAISNVLMTKMVFGRYVYAIGGNKEAARLSGVPITRMVIYVFTICGFLAGVGGVILASQLNSGSPTYGLTYELYVIAAVVIGGTSLMGGEGKIWGTLIGAFIIGVIQNGMNLVGIESYTQKVILGLLILAALLIEKIRKPS